MKTRREALKTIAAAASSVPVMQGQHTHSGNLVQIATPYVRKFFTAGQYELLAKLVDLIIPRSDTPGASDAGVPAFIDRAVSANKSLQARFREGLDGLDTRARQSYGSPFTKLSLEQQVAILTPLSRDKTSRAGRFFQTVKDMTVDAYYSSREGLVTELGWHGNTYLREFPGCTHPEHQV